MVLTKMNGRVFRPVHFLPDHRGNYDEAGQRLTVLAPAAFLAFGVAAGSILRMVKADDMNRLMQWVALAGFAFFLAGQYCSNYSYSLYPHAEFWLNSPWMVAMKLGPVLLLIAVAYLWTEYGAKGWSPLRQFGVTSLLVYWVHVELVSGAELG